MGRDSSFLTHAVSAPEFTSDKAHRPRLTRELQDYLERQLILIVAPAGYGKTTFLADFTEQTDVPVCWVRLSPADHDPARLASVVWESLCRRFRRLRSVLSLNSEVGLTPQALARSIGEALASKVPERFVLIVDDFHLIHPSEESIRFVDALLTELPASATLVVASRELPRLSLAQWIADDQVKTFGPEELALTRDELNDLVEVRTGAPLESEVAGEMLAETEGWVTGVLLSERLLGRALPTLAASEQPLAYEYLAQAAFHRQPADVQAFMMRSAVMPVMTSAACDRVLNRTDSQAVLTQLLRRGLFVSATGASPRIYEYHHLFRAFLLEQLEREDPELADDLRLAAADHFSESDWPEVAFQLAAAAGDHARAAAIAEQHVDRLFELGRDRTVLDWAQAIWDADEMAARTFTRAAMVNSSQLHQDQAEQWLMRAQIAIQQEDDRSFELHYLYCSTIVWGGFGLTDKWPPLLNRMHEIADPSDPYHQAVITLSMACDEIYRNVNLDKGRYLAEEAAKLALYCEDGTLISHSQVTLGVGECLLGKLNSGREHFRRALDHVDEEDMLRRKPTILNDLGMSELMLADFSACIRHLSEGRALARRINRPREEIVCVVSLGDAYRSLGFFDRSRQSYRTALRLCEELGEDAWDSYCAAKMAATYRKQGDQHQARLTLRSNLPKVGAKIHAVEVMVEEFSATTLETPQAVLEGVEQLNADPQSTVASRIEATMVGVGKLLSLGAGEDARSLLGRALSIADNTDSAFVIASEAECFPEIEDLLVSLSSGHPSGMRALNYIQEIRRYRGESSGQERATGQVAEFRALGECEITLADKSEPGLRPLHIEILFFLLDHVSVPREHLKEVFWPGQDPEQQGANAHTALHEIRKMMGSDFVATRGNSYDILPEHTYRYDVAEFERLTNRLDRSRPSQKGLLAEALQLYKGAFMPGWHSPWVIQRRRELEADFLRVSSQLASMQIEEGEDEAAIDVLSIARECDPYDEALISRQLAALQNLGRVADAVRMFKQYEKRLAEDLQLAPSAELRQQLARITVDRGAIHWMFETGRPLH